MRLRFNLQNRSTPGSALPGLLLSVLLLSGALAPARAVAAGFTYSRNIPVPADVAAAGWVRVPLDADTLRHMAPGGADLQLFNPAGDQIAFRLAASLPESGRRPVQVQGTEKGEDGWTLLLDAGAGPVPHERLILDLGAQVPNSPPNSPLRLEGSPDGSAWQLLVEGIPGRIEGEQGREGRLALSYPSTPDRYLRLTGQGTLGKAPVAEVETVTGPTLALATRGASCDRTSSSGPRVACALDLPAGQIVRRITVELKGIGPVGYRLYEPREARWHLLAEGVWETAGEPSRHVVAGGPEPVAGSALRLELQGPEETVPVLTGYGVDLAVPMVLFQAAQPGRYVLAYGSAMGEPVPQKGSADPARATWVEPGPEQAHPERPLPSAPGAPLEGIRFSSSWNIASEAEPGQLVRLEIPAAVYGASRESLADLRLSVAGRQVPFFRWSPPEPALTAGDTGSRPGESDTRGESRVVVSLPAGGLPLTQIHLTAPGIPLRRAVSVRYVDPGRGPGTEDLARSNWTCVPEPPLPCREELPLTAPAPRLLTVRFQDGDNPPLPALDVQVWRRRDVLLFVWPDPGKGEVQLLVGAQGLEEPRYDLAALGPALTGHPWEPAEIRSEHTGPPWWSGWVLPLGLTAAGIWLLVLLRRILSDAEVQT